MKLPGHFTLYPAPFTPPRLSELSQHAEAIPNQEMRLSGVCIHNQARVQSASPASALPHRLRSWISSLGVFRVEGSMGLSALEAVEVGALGTKQEEHVAPHVAWLSLLGGIEPWRWDI